MGFNHTTIDACRRAQLNLAVEDARVFLLEQVLERHCYELLSDELRVRCLSAALSEASMVAIAAGLALQGKVPFVNTPDGAVLIRACEQVRVDICYHETNVKIAGFFSAKAAASSPAGHCKSDVTVARSLPNMTIVVPADAVTAYKATRAAVEHSGPVYIRLEAGTRSSVYSGNVAFSIGKGIVLREGHDVTIVAAGPSAVAEALTAGEILQVEGLSARVVDMHSIKPIDRPLLVCAARETGLVVTVEQHATTGGLGGAVAEVLAEEHPVPMQMLGLVACDCEQVPMAGLQARQAGLNASGIAACIREALARVSHRR